MFYSGWISFFLIKTLLIETNNGLRHHIDKRQIVISSCSRTPCANGGTCISISSNMFACICTGSFTGPTCTLNSGSVTSTPLSSMCPNGVKCLNGKDFFLFN